MQILNGIDGVLEAGEMLVVLGPPGRSVLALPTHSFADSLVVGVRHC